MAHILLSKILDTAPLLQQLAEVTWVNKREDAPEHERHLHLEDEPASSVLVSATLAGVWDEIESVVSEDWGQRIELGTHPDKRFAHIRYPEGTSMPLHEDSPSADVGDNFVTILVYLNDNYEGGELVVNEEPEEFSYKPAAGDVVLVAAGTPHASSEVASGVKVIAVGHYKLVPDDV